MLVQTVVVVKWQIMCDLGHHFTNFIWKLNIYIFKIFNGIKGFGVSKWVPQLTLCSCLYEISDIKKEVSFLLLLNSYYSVPTDFA